MSSGMISNKCFTVNFLDDLSTKFKGTDKILIQKQVMALALVYYLRHSRLDFIFKGGTSLLLLINTPIRLSLDVDIIVSNANDLMDAFEYVIKYKQPNNFRILTITLLY
jgi:hypothetical protein